MKKITESEVLIVGLVRNSEMALENDVFRLNQAFSSFKTIRWLIIESDSQDGTSIKLHEISKKILNFDYLSLGTLSGAMPKRTERLAHCRNRYLKEIRNNQLYADVDYVAIADLDGVNKLITKDAVESCWLRDGWDVCAANQNGPYYDIWALRHPIWSPNDCWAQCRFLEALGTSHEKAKQAAVYAKQVTIPQSADWIEVDSAFGGLAIYKVAALAKGEYFGLGQYGEEVCDHPFLHKSMREAGKRIFINPKLINTDLTEHTQHLGNKPKLLYL